MTLIFLYTAVQWVLNLHGRALEKVALQMGDVARWSRKDRRVFLGRFRPHDHSIRSRIHITILVALTGHFVDNIQNQLGDNCTPLHSGLRN